MTASHITTPLNLQTFQVTAEHGDKEGNLTNAFMTEVLRTDARFYNSVALTDKCTSGGTTTHMCNKSDLGCLEKSKAESVVMKSLRITMHDTD